MRPDPSRHSRLGARLPHAHGDELVQHIRQALAGALVQVRLVQLGAQNAHAALRRGPEEGG